MAITTLGFGLFVRLGLNSPLAEIVTMEIVASLGVGLVFQPPLIALQSLVKSDDIATATALFGLIRSLSTSVSIVIGGVIFQNKMQAHYNQFRSFLPASTAQKFSSDIAAANIYAIRAISPVQKTIIKASYAESLSTMWILYAPTAGIGLLLSFLTSKQKLSSEHVEVKTGLMESKHHRPHDRPTANESSTLAQQTA